MAANLPHRRRPIIKLKKIEKSLRAQGLKGNSYRFLFGDLKEMTQMSHRLWYVEVVPVLTCLIGHNFGASVVYGDMSHQDRYWVLNQFLPVKSLIFVPTDVDTQDLDIKDVRVVNNYDFLNGIEVMSTESE
ncbi:unnamed protein product [Lactuca saligna]|uniref:Helicase C-terminal domain-containing protein n=1 Tax=Lactuca saligna TaxID=75948 RepID=A0AA35Z9Y9_LACSI|nr:unnamed protein product [Lactuca saligna]